MIFTIFTPVYNRAILLPKLYGSLMQQEFKDFEWLVVDDGSTDNIVEIMNTFQSDTNRFFKINFIQQENSGKHAAINKGVEFAKGDYFFIVDSDDYITETSLSKAWRWIQTLTDEFCGVVGLMRDTESKMIGTTFSGDKKDISYNERKLYNITGDKVEIYRTDIYRQFKFPVFKGETFLSESVVFKKIGNVYKERHFNEIIYVANYLNDGISNNIEHILLKNPKGLAYTINTEHECDKASIKTKLASYYYYQKLFSKKMTDGEILEILKINWLTLIVSKMLWSIKNTIRKNTL